MKNKLFLLALTVLFGVTASAQELLVPSLGFSKKKTSYVTLQNGTELEGVLKDLDYKKGLIEEITIVDNSGKKHKLEPSSVKFMYLFPSGFDKFGKVVEATHNVQKWNDKDLNQAFLDRGYVYFETIDVKISKKKTIPLLMQLLNPDFSKKVKIYFDPYAGKTASLGIGSVKVVGGNEKSYFIKFPDDPAAFKLEKKDYDKKFAELWKKCTSLSKTTDIKWNDLTNHIIQYTECE